MHATPPHENGWLGTEYVHRLEDHCTHCNSDTCAAFLQHSTNLAMACTTPRPDNTTTSAFHTRPFKILYALLPEQSSLPPLPGPATFNQSPDGGPALVLHGTCIRSGILRTSPSPPQSSPSRNSTFFLKHPSLDPPPTRRSR